MAACQAGDGDGEELLVHNWRVTRLTRLGVPGSLAEAYADRLDWHQVRPAGAARLPPAAGPAHRPVTGGPVRRPARDKSPGSLEPIVLFAQATWAVTSAACRVSGSSRGLPLLTGRHDGLVGRSIARDGARKCPGVAVAFPSVCLLDGPVWGRLGW
jgi:hypothetical protein